MSDGYRRQVGEEKTCMSVTFELPRTTEKYVARSWLYAIPNCNYLSRLKHKWKTTDRLYSMLSCRNKFHILNKAVIIKN